MASAGQDLGAAGPCGCRARRLQAGESPRTRPCYVPKQFGGNDHRPTCRALRPILASASCSPRQTNSCHHFPLSAIERTVEYIARATIISTLWTNPHKNVLSWSHNPPLFTLGSEVRSLPPTGLLKASRLWVLFAVCLPPLSIPDRKSRRPNTRRQPLARRTSTCGSRGGC